ncbi:MAG TPA: hypothetical protein VH590_03525 [Ktedonobacterales bacterium]|jgi:hypothetical protein
MLITPHALVGAAIGLRLKHPLKVIPVAMASHFLLDMVPHWQETLAPYRPGRATWIRLPIDMGLAVLGVTWIARSGSKRQRVLASAVVVGALAGTLPDLDALACANPLLLRNGLLKRYFFWHCGIQDETSQGWGLAPQIAVSLAALALALARPLPWRLKSRLEATPPGPSTGTPHPLMPGGCPARQRLA